MEEDSEATVNNTDDTEGVNEYGATGNDETEQGQSPGTDLEDPGPGHAGSEIASACNCDSGSQSEMDRQMWLNNVRRILYRSLLSLLREHPSTGIQIRASETGEQGVVERLACLTPEKKAFLSYWPPLEALDQFDEVLNELIDKQELVHWLKRLALVKLMLI